MGERNDEKHYLLLVEDERIVALSTRHALEAAGYAVTTAADGEAALALLTTEPRVDLVLMDIDLGPGMDGVATASALLERRALPIVFLTSHTEQAMVERVAPITRYGYVDKRSGTFVLLEAVARALQLFETEQQLRAIVSSRVASEIEELSYRSLFDAAPNPITIYDREARFVDLNKSALDWLGMSREQVFMRPLADIVPQMHEQTKQRVARCVDDGDRGHYVDRLEMRDGTVCWLSSTFERVQLPGRSEAVAQVISFDITEKKAEEAARAEQERLTDALMSAAPLMIYIYDVTEEQNVWVNDKYRRFLEEVDPDFGTNLSRNAILGLIHPDDRHVITDRDERRRQGRARPDEALEFRLGHGEHWRWMINRSAPFEYGEDGSVQKIIGFLFDITDQKQIQRQLEDLVEKNELLMQEMNHRVKNNLLMVRSLIHLTEAESGIDLSDLAHQVTSISLVHELLHESETTEKINIRSYLGRILESIFPPHGSHHVVVENNIASADFSPKAAGVVGLIVNEAATNAAKHAFTRSETHRFAVTLERPAPDEWQLTIENTGRPFPEDVSLENPTSLGLRLITMLASQLGGTVTLERAPLTRFLVRFPEEDQELG